MYARSVNLAAGFCTGNGIQDLNGILSGGLNLYRPALGCFLYGKYICRVGHSIYRQPVRAMYGLDVITSGRKFKDLVA